MATVVQPVPFIQPNHALGAELVYWREDGHRHTLVTITTHLFAAQIGADVVELTFALHDAEGRFVTSWAGELRGPDDTLFLDSRGRAAADPLVATIEEGALVVWVSAPSAKSPSKYVRAYVLVDWFSDDGELCSLHSDQSIVMSRVNEGEACDPIDLTEMVFEETASGASLGEARTSLLIVNGPLVQPRSGLRLLLRNHRGETRSVEYTREMAPFSVHRIVLGQLTDNLAEFCDGESAFIAGQFSARGIFTRPYVMTEGTAPSGYHGGNCYHGMDSIPRIVHRTFPYAEATGSVPVPREMMLVTGQKQMNPGYAIHDDSITTRVHLFQSHGTIDEDFAVDASLYDRSGRLVVHRERCAIARRNGSSVLSVAELAEGNAFEGHIALRFSDDEAHEEFPFHLQALMEYRTAVSVARVMLWSDRWNAADRLLDQDTFRALYRVFTGSGARARTSILAITNPGVGTDYDCEAPYIVRLKRTAGREELVHHGTLAPNGTTIATIGELFPSVCDETEEELAIAIVESAFDLASIHLTKDLRSGVVAAEHLLAVVEDWKSTRVCGA